MAGTKNSNNKVLAAIVLILLFVAVIGLSYLIVSGLTYFICLAFGIEWSWLIGLGVWAACILARWVLTAAKSGSK